MSGQARVNRKLPRSLVALPVLLAVAVAVTMAVGQPGHAAANPHASHDELVAKGSQLFITGCSSCHGIDGKGLKTVNGDERGPSLVDTGEAAAYFQLHTGRMPLGSSNDIPIRKRPAYDDDQIAALVAYVGSLGSGPPIPEVSTSKGHVQDGGELFRTNCAACHSATGAGGALSYGKAAPALGQSTPLDVGTAIRSGPGQMPRFGTDTLSKEQVDSIARYVEYLRHPRDPGGVSLGRLGPIPEGFLVWVVGMGGLLVATGFIGKHNKVRHRRRTRSPST